MNTSINQVPLHGRRKDDVRPVKPILLKVPDLVVKALDFNYIPSDLGVLIRLYQTIHGGHKRTLSLQSIVEHREMTSETLQALFFEAKLDVEKSTIASALFTRYPEDTETSIFLLQYGREYINAKDLEDLKRRYAHLIENGWQPGSLKEVN